jgi:hypothetical protein
MHLVEDVQGYAELTACNLGASAAHIPISPSLYAPQCSKGPLLLGYSIQVRLVFATGALEVLLCTQ